MKLLMIVIDESKKEELEVYLSRSGVLGYTEIPHAAGMGETGPRLGSRAFPKTSAVIFTILEDDAVAKLRQGIQEFCRDCGERVRIVSWGVEQII